MTGGGEMFHQDPTPTERDRMRRFYGEVWRKHLAGLALEPLERLIAGVILQHPEYQSLLEGEEPASREFLPELGETNPFLHMGMHIAIQEQLAADRPAGIRALYQVLRPAFGDDHEVEHHIMECLGESLWHAQRQGTMPDEAGYLECLRRLVHQQGAGP
jgi:hypothetical protein